MKFGIVLSSNIPISETGLSDTVRKIMNNLNDLLKSKDYGDDLKTIFIKVICVPPEAEFLYKEKKPNYKKGLKTRVTDGRPYETEDALTYGINLDYQFFLSASKFEAEKMLMTKILESFKAFDVVKIKLFDRFKFEQDIKDYFDSWLA